MTTPILPRGKSGQKITLLSVGPEAALVIQIGHVRYQLKAQDMPMWQRLLLPSNPKALEDMAVPTWAFWPDLCCRRCFSLCSTMQHKSDQNAQLDAATSFKVFGLWSMLESLPSLYVPGF